MINTIITGIIFGIYIIGGAIFYKNQVQLMNNGDRLFDNEIKDRILIYILLFIWPIVIIMNLMKISSLDIKILLKELFYE